MEGLTEDIPALFTLPLILKATRETTCTRRLFDVHTCALESEILFRRRRRRHYNHRPRRSRHRRHPHHGHIYRSSFSSS